MEKLKESPTYAEMFGIVVINCPAESKQQPRFDVTGKKM
jgi:hypothetical protein